MYIFLAKGFLVFSGFSKGSTTSKSWKDLNTGTPGCNQGHSFGKSLLCIATPGQTTLGKLPFSPQGFPKHSSEGDNQWSFAECGPLCQIATNWPTEWMRQGLLWFTNKVTFNRTAKVMRRLRPVSCHLGASTSFRKHLAWTIQLKLDAVGVKLADKVKETAHGHAHRHIHICRRLADTDGSWLDRFDFGTSLWYLNHIHNNRSQTPSFYICAWTSDTEPSVSSDAWQQQPATRSPVETTL